MKFGTGETSLDNQFLNYIIKNERAGLGYKNSKITQTRLGWYLSNKIKLTTSI